MKPPRTGRKDTRELIAWAAGLGFICSKTNSNHLKFVHPAVPSAVFTPSTPRNRNGYKERQKLRTALLRATEGSSA